MKRIAFLVCVVSICVFKHADAGEKNCSVVACNAGTKAITHVINKEPFFVCPNQELAEYTNMVLGLMAFSVTFTGQPPNISDKTGEPEYRDETKAILDSRRGAAHVKSFDQAVSMCEKGKNKTRVIVLNNPSDSGFMYVLNEKNNKTFWLPKIFLDKR